MIYSNFHTHSLFSDGKAEMQVYCEKALELGFHSLGFSDHAPVKFKNSFSIEDGQLMAYFDRIDTLKKEYEGRLNVFKSIEADFVPEQSFDFNFFRDQSSMDYIIGSIHLVLNPKTKRKWFIDGGDQNIWDIGLQEIFEGDVKRGVRSFYEQTMEMIESQKPDVVGHLDKIKMHNKERLFSTNDQWYKDLIDASLNAIKKNNSILEINTRGLYKGRSSELFPSILILKKAQKMGIPLILNSDAHHPDELNGAYSQVLESLRENHIQELVEYDGEFWKPRNISSQ